MDNLETNSNPQGGEGATSSQGQLDAQETQPVKDAEVVSDNQPSETGEASNPWDNDPKFKGKSAADIYKAQQEAEKLIGKLGQEAKVSRALQEKFGATPEQILSQIEAQEQRERQQYYANNPLAPVLEKVQSLEQVIQRQEQEKALAAEEKELDGFLKSNPEYQPYRDKILKLGLTSEQDKPYGDIAREWFGEVRAQGQQDAYKKIDVKQKTQMTGSSTASGKKGGYSSLSDLSRKDRIKAFEQMMSS